MKVLIPTVAFVLGLAIAPPVQKDQQDGGRVPDAVLDQMRQIAREMKACGEEVQSQTDLAIYYSGPPASLDWSVKRADGGPAAFQGVITFTLPERSEETDKAKRSSKLHKEFLETEAYRAELAEHGRYQYEFDLGNGKPDLTKTLFIDAKTKATKPAPKVPGHLTCWEAAARSIQQNN